MIDLAIGVETRNYSLKRGSDLRTVLELLKTVGPLFVIACAFSFQLWIRAQSIQIGYSTQQLKKQAGKLMQSRQQFALEEQALKNLAAMDLMARNNPGVIILRANPAIPSQFDNRDANSSRTPELETLVRLSGSQKTSALN